MEKGRRGFTILTCNPIEKKPLGRLRHRWEDNVRMYLKGIDVNARN